MFQELRPLDALYLLSRAGEEELTLKTGLTAISSYLYNSGYTKYEGENLKINLDCKKNFGDLYQYEWNTLLCLDMEDYFSIQIPLLSLNFEKHLEKKGFLEYDFYDGFYRTTKKSLKVIERLNRLKNSDRIYNHMMSAAFPSLLKDI